MFSLFNYSPIFYGGQLTPFAPTCGRPWTAHLLIDAASDQSSHEQIISTASVGDWMDRDLRLLQGPD